MQKINPDKAVKNSEDFAALQITTYKNIASTFDAVCNRNNRNHLNKIKAISHFLNIKDGDKVLEIGIGTGIHAEHFLKLNKNIDFTFHGIDISEDMLKQAKNKVKDRVIIAAMAGEDLKFENNFFDKIYISGSLHHFGDPELGIEELLRVLKPGGKFCFMEPNFYFPHNFVNAYRLPEEVNMKMMKKSNFNTWLGNKDKITYEMVNFAYTPPFPTAFIKYFDLIDKLIAKIPILRNFSVMLFVYGTKTA